MLALVTGSSGLLGCHLVEVLLEEGLSVRAFDIRPHEDHMQRQNVEFRQGDISDRTQVDDAVRGCNVVFHAAGLVSYWRGHIGALKRVNVVGTRNVVQAAIQNRIDRLVHTSTVAAIGYNPFGLANESTPYNLGADGNGYPSSKRDAEEEVGYGVNQGLDAVIVNPGGLIDSSNPSSSTARLYGALKHHLIFGAPSGGVNVVGARDAAIGHVQALCKGKSGMRYILGGENLTHRKLLELMADICGATAPRLEIPAWIMKSVAHASDAVASLTRRPPYALTAGRAALSDKKLFYDSKLAQTEIGFFAHSARQVLSDAYERLVRHS